MLRRYLAVLLVLLWGGYPAQPAESAASPGASQSGGFPGCQIAKTADVHFRNSRERDRLRVEIAGSPCYEARLTITIRTRGGTELYRYEAPFKPHIAVHWADLQVPKYPKAFVDQVLAEGPGSSASLPPYLPKEEFYEEHYEELLIDRESYERLRASGRPIFSHPTHYEAWVHVTYDERAGRAVVFMRGGL